MGYKMNYSWNTIYIVAT
jgi:ligand-binding SRPBCC domain-containing protein